MFNHLVILPLIILMALALGAFLTNLFWWERRLPGLATALTHKGIQNGMLIQARQGEVVSWYDRKEKTMVTVGWAKDGPIPESVPADIRARIEAKRDMDNANRADLERIFQNARNAKNLN